MADFVARVRYAAIATSSISAVSSLIVVVSYICTLMQYRAHQRRLLDASAQATSIPLQPMTFSCESSLATPLHNTASFFQPPPPPPPQYATGLNIQIGSSTSQTYKAPEPTAGTGGDSKPQPVRRKLADLVATVHRRIWPQPPEKRRIARIPSSKIAVLACVDCLLHILWILNTTFRQCSATLFFYQWIQLFYVFFLTAFAARSALRLRSLAPVPMRHARRTDLVFSAATGAASFVLSLLPALMGTATRDADLNACWFARSDPTALRWVWVTLNAWVVLCVLFLGATAVLVAVVLTRERQNLRDVIAPQPGFARPPLHPVALAHEALHGHRPPRCSASDARAYAPGSSISPHSSRFSARSLHAARPLSFGDSESSRLHCAHYAIGSSRRLLHGSMPSVVDERRSVRSVQYVDRRSLGNTMAMYGVARSLQKREMRHMSMPIPSARRPNDAEETVAQMPGRQEPPANRTAKHSATAALRPSTMWKRRDSPPLSHLQRIEARVRILVATGALRVGARALVPVLTQLAMVVWSTLHSLGASTHVCYVAYSVAIMLLSLQGTLDMALYYIFDTHSDAASHASLPYYFFPQHSSIRHLPATASSQQFWCRRSSDRKHATPMRTSSSSNPHRSAYKHPLQSAHHRSFSLSPGYDSALRKFTFNADSLNMRRAHNRTSNAMQSDTLHGSEHMAWSHIDTSSALSMRAVDTISVSQYSTHQQASFLATPRMQMPGTRPMPVLTGWEEVDLEDAASSPTDRSQDYATPDGTPCPSASPPD